MTIRIKSVPLARLLFLLPWALIAVAGRAAPLSSRWQLLPGSPAGAQAIAAVHETIYVGTSHGLSRSRSAEGPWELVSNLNVSQLVPVPGDASRMFAIAYTRVSPGYANYLLFQTRDAGDTWPLSLFDIYSVVVDPIDPNIAYAAMAPFLGLASGDVLRTSDGGATWAFLPTDSFACPVGPRPPYCYAMSALAINPRDPVELYVEDAFSGTMYKTADGGLTWSPRHPNQSGGPSLIVVDPVFPSNVYARWYTGPYPGVPGILRSTDGGETWTLLHVEGDAGGPLAIEPGTGSLFLGMPAGLLRSDDRGDHWTDVSGGLDGLPVSSLAFDGAGRLYAGTGVGVFVLPLIGRSTRVRPEVRAVPWR